MTLLEEIGQELQIPYDETSNLCFGIAAGHYMVLLNPQDKVYELVYSVAQNDEAPTTESLTPLVDASSNISKVKVTGTNVIFIIKYAVTKSKSIERIREAMEEIGTYFDTHHFTDVCQVTGQATTHIYQSGEKIVFVNEEGAARLEAELDEGRDAANSTKEQFIPGVIGALIGSLVGVAVIVLIGQLGFVASISGVVMGLCVVKGYERLGKKFTKKGVFTTVVIVLAMTYVAYQLDWAISLAKLVELDVFSAFQGIHHWLASGDIDVETYYAGLFKLYLFSLGGFVPTLLSAIAQSKIQFQLRQLL